MTLKKPRAIGLTIVLTGSFNPSIFHPAWFSHEELLRPSEADAAKIELIHPEISVTNYEGFSLLVANDRFQIRTTEEPYYHIIRDLAMGTFQILSHTPIRQMGINLDMHFQLENEEQWHNLGHILAPKKVWSEVVKEPGLLSLVMQSKRQDDCEGSINIKVEPSRNFHPGVYFNINDHYELASNQDQVGAKAMVPILQTHFDTSISSGQRMAQGLMSNVG